MNSRRGQLLAYAVATIAQAGAGVLMVPLLARVLERQVFGAWALLEPTLLVAVQIGLFGADYGVVKLVGHDGHPPQQAFRLLARIACFTALASAAVIGLGAAWWAQSARLGLLVAWAVAAEAVYMLAIAALRGGNQATGFACGVLTKSACVLMAATGAVLFKWPHLGNLADVVAIYALASTLGLLAAGLALRRTKSGRPGPALPATVSLWRSTAQYGLPLLCAGLLTSVVAVGDRYVIGLQLGVAEVASYAVAVKLANLLNLLANPVNLWFPAARFSHAKDADHGQAFFSVLALRVTYGYLSIGALMWLLTPLLLPWFAPGFDWSPSTGGFLVAAAACFAMSPPFNIGLLAAGRTRWNFVIALCVALLQLSLLFSLVPILGAPGAALCTFIAQACSLGLQHWGSQRVHPLRWPYGRLGFMWLAAIGLAISVYLWIGPHGWAGIATTLGLFLLGWLPLGWFWLKPAPGAVGAHALPMASSQ